MKAQFLILGLAILILACNAANEKASVPESVDKDSMELAIAYNVLVNSDSNNYEVYTMNIDGSEKVNISGLPGVEWTYASERNNLYFISDKDTCNRCFFLYKTNYLGQEVKKASNIRLKDSWMSFRNNGTEIIVNPHSSVDSVFLIINEKGKVVKRLPTGLPGASDPLFVNNGNQVAFRGGNKRSKREEGYEEEIYIINVDGTGLKQLTKYPRSDTTAPWYAYKAGPPKLHPTENFISYASYQNGKYSLYGVTIDGEKQWKLTDNEFWEVYHDWSPDGKWLATDLSNSEESHYDIGLINWQTKELKILTDTSFHYQQSPNFVMKNI